MAGAGGGFNTSINTARGEGQVRRISGGGELKPNKLTAAENVATLQLLPVIEDPSRQLQERRGPTSIPVLEEGGPLG